VLGVKKVAICAAFYAPLMRQCLHPLQQHALRQVPDAFVTRPKNIRPGQDGGGHMDGILRALCGCFSPQFGGRKQHVADDWQPSILLV
jgi:hypothetical protein